MIKRPTSLLDVSRRVSQGGNFTFAMKAFVDAFATSQSVDALLEEPVILGDPVQNAYLAGVAEYLAFRLGQPAPEWCEKPERYLKEPFYFGGEHSRAMLMTETPFAFRKRLLFCGKVLQKIEIAREGKGDSE